jgi:hypothetical protein
MELLKILVRYIDATATSVLSNVLKMFDELQGDAHLVRPLNSLR